MHLGNVFNGELAPCDDCMHRLRCATDEVGCRQYVAYINATPRDRWVLLDKTPVLTRREAESGYCPIKEGKRRNRRRRVSVFAASHPVNPV